jgi:hypothetical protein
LAVTIASGRLFGATTPLLRPVASFVLEKAQNDDRRMIAQEARLIRIK